MKIISLVRQMVLGLSLYVFCVSIDKGKGGIGNGCSSRGFIQVLLHVNYKSFDVNPCFPARSLEIIGFTNLGNFNEQLLQAEREMEINCVHPPIAKQILGIMIQGFFLKFEFPLAHFPTCGVTGDTLFPIVWEAVRVLESTGLKTIAITADGASPNWKFFRMHKSEAKIV